MDPEILEQFQILLDAIEKNAKESEARIIARTEIVIEAKVSKRIDGL